MIFFFLIQPLFSARAEILKNILLLFLVETRAPKWHFDINWQTEKQVYPYFFSKCTKSHMKGLKNSPFDVGGIPKEDIQGLNAGLRAQITESHFDFWCLKNWGLFLSRVANVSDMNSIEIKFRSVNFSWLEFFPSNFTGRWILFQQQRASTTQTHFKVLLKSARGCCRTLNETTTEYSYMFSFRYDTHKEVWDLKKLKRTQCLRSLEAFN